MNGNWLLTVTSLRGNSGSEQTDCSSSASTALTLVQSGSDLSGQYVGGQLNCPRASGDTTKIHITTGQIQNGVVSGNQVSFNLSGVNLIFSGSAATDTMAGTIGGHVEDLNLNGSWSAHITQ